MGVLTAPPVAPIRQRNTHRLVPVEYAERSPLEQITERGGQLHDMSALAAAADDAELGGEGVGSGRLIIAESFAYSRRRSGRFNGAGYGAWYAGFELETSQAEVAWHKWIALQRIGQAEENRVYIDILADFEGEYHDIRAGEAYRPCLHPESYAESQALAAQLVRAGSGGVIYPSVRYSGGTCLACFRPHLVGNIREGARYRFTWEGAPKPTIEPEESS